MARLDDLIRQVADDALRQELQEVAAATKKRQEFGLVFEEHIPETTSLHGLPLKIGAIVDLRTEPGGIPYQLVELNKASAVIESLADRSEAWEVDPSDLLVVKRFGEPIYPALRSLGSVQRGDARPHHAVINGENFHALQLLAYLYEGQVDCIYIDPPYNTGATDWKYNNHYVDANDGWRHSKWLSMMEKRLRLTRRLLKPDGVLIVTIDENEVHHLGMLLEGLLPDAERQMVSICINPSGVSGGGLSRVDEYAFFCALGGAQPGPSADDMLTELIDEDTPVDWESLLRRGNVWYRETRPNLCYPVMIDPDSKRIVGVGEPWAPEDDDDEDARPKEIDGYSLAWPVRTDLRLGIWRVDGARLMNLVERGYAYATSFDERRSTWTVKYLMSGAIDLIASGEVFVTGRGERGEVVLESKAQKRSIAKTMWHRGRHTAGGAGGTQALNALLGRRGLFPFPKSVYAVRDCIDVAIGARSDALILDFFAGSGTTLHATCLLNAADGGVRRCVLVTNSEVDAETTAHLNGEGLYRGDAEFDSHGIFAQATRPRCEAVITGNRPDGKPVEGYHIDGRPYAEGFPENVEFFQLDYLDPDEVGLGKQFEAILPALWLSARGVGPRESPSNNAQWTMPEGSTYAVLFHEARFGRFLTALEKRPEVTHVWLVTDSDESFAEMRSQLPKHIQLSMLYRDYLRNFMINTERNL